MYSNLYFKYDDEHVSKLKDTNNTLLLQNRLLKNQLINFQHLHYQVCYLLKLKC